MTTTTPDMSLILPDVLSTVGPTYATLLNAALSIIDSHTHAPGSGAQITPSGINISSDLSFNQNNATNLRSLRLYPNSSFSTGINDRTCMYALNGELHYIDAAGNDIQMTLDGNLNLSASITGLTLKDSALTLQYFGDTSKQMRFDASQITAGQTRVYSLPDVAAGTDTLVALTPTQTITNKTMGSTNTLTGVRMASITPNGSNTVTFPVATDTLVGKATTDTLTNKILTGNTIASFTPDGGTHTLTAPSVTDTLAGIAATQTLTNKTFTAPVQSSYEVFTEISTPSTPSAGTVSIYAKSDNNMYYLNSSGLEQQIGSGSTSGINYIANPGFENGTVTGWATYSGGTTTPTSGTGGSPVTTFTISSINPLRGSYDGLWSKSANNRQGEGFSYAFTLAAADTGKTMQITFDSIASANMVSGDMAIYVYDVTNSALITPSATAVPTGTSGQYSVAFAATTGTSYRLIFHTATTSALAYTLHVDGFQVGPRTNPLVAGTSDWISYTPTIGAGFGSVTNNSAFYRRIGDSVQISGSFTSGTVAASPASVSLPSGLTLNTSKLSFSANTTSTSGDVLGVVANSGSANAAYVVSAPGTSAIVVYFAQRFSGSSSSIPNASASGTWITSDVVTYSFLAPITNWSSNITLSSTSNPLEFFYNTSGLTTAGSSDTSSFGYGAGGALIGAIASTTITGNSVTKMRVSSTQAVLATDRVELQLNDGTASHGWIPAETLFPLTIQGVATYGMKMVAISPTTWDVSFGNGGCISTGTTYTANGTTWTSGAAGYLWRVAKYSSIGGAELAPATSVSSGSITRENVWTAYTPTFSAGFGTVTNAAGMYKVLGDSLLIRASCTTGTVAGSVASITIPSGFTISSTKLTINNSSAAAGNIIGQFNCATITAINFVVTAPSTSTSLVYISGASGIPGNGSGVAASTNIMSIYCEVPIV